MDKKPASPQDSFNKAAAWPHNLRLAEILDTLDKHGTADLSVNDVCKLTQFIKNAIITQAEQDKLLILDKDRYITGLAGDSFPREIKALTRLAYSIDFSSTLQAWAQLGLRKLTARMAQEHTADQMRALWNRMDENGRFSYMRAINVMQTQAFSEPQITFVPADIRIKKIPERILGTFQFEGDILHQSSQPVIHLDPANLQKSSFEIALESINHEGLHSMLRQLARFHHAEKMAKNHPLYSDAGLMLSRIKYNSYLSSMFRCAYRADVEERFCFQHGPLTALFQTQPGKPTGWTERLRGFFPR